MSKDRWDKTEIILKAFSGILIPAVLLICGYYLNLRQTERNSILRETEMIKGFLPHLDKSRSTALAAFKVLETSLEEWQVVELSANFQSEAAIDYLLEKSNSTDANLAKLARDSLEAMDTIVLMDSAHPSNVYDNNTAANHGTNADDLYVALQPLPLGPLFREEVYEIFNRTETIAALRPAVIICHYSSFEFAASGQRSPSEELKVFTQKIMELSPKTKFVIYSRWSDIAEKTKNLGIKSSALESVQIPQHPKDSFRLYSNYIKIIISIKKLLNVGPTRLKAS